MENPNFDRNSNKNSEILDILSSEGVEFLVSHEDNKVVPLQSLKGKTLCLFFSSSWCRPCTKFTPLLVQLYQNVITTHNYKLEIIFVSFDRDQNEYNEHFKSMPWLGIPFDTNLRQKLSNKYCVDRIPSLVPLISDGLMIEDDLIGLIEEYGVEALPFSRKRREELKAMDEAKRQGGKLHQILGQNHVVRTDGTKVLVSELESKTIGLYFCGHWCPPCHTFTAQLTEAYSNLIATTNKQFEVILVSTDRDQNEYELHLKTMPWLAIPYNDKRRQELCRIFKIKSIPALVIIGSDGKSVSTNGKKLVSLYGAEAYPFTESRVLEIEEKMKKAKEGLSEEVKDIKHPHVLKLEMANAYVCDSCNRLGRFWTFSCHVCDYDLHPLCVEQISSC